MQALSLRNDRDQLAAEDNARRDFMSTMAPDEQRFFRSMTKEEVAELDDCPLHVSKHGVFCGKSFGSFWNCIERRKRAAKIKATT